MEPIGLLHCPPELSTDLYPEPHDPIPYPYHICMKPIYYYFPMYD
jgi:hypothetical protein